MSEHRHRARFDAETGALIPCECGYVPVSYRMVSIGTDDEGRTMVRPEMVFGPDPFDYGFEADE